MLVPVVEGPSTRRYDTMHLDPVTADDFVLRLAGQPDGPAHGAHRGRRGGHRVGRTTVEVRDEVVHDLPPGHVLQVAIHRHGRAPATPVAALLADYATTPGARLDRSHRHHRRPRHPQPRGVRPRPDDMALAANTVIAVRRRHRVVTEAGG